MLLSIRWPVRSPGSLPARPGCSRHNRFVMAPLTKSFSPGGVATAQVAAYYRPGFFKPFRFLQNCLRDMRDRSG
ncbi:hypothetical protein CXP47_17065 [Pseudomonas chlororaphis]|nr:hypothetical protein CXP47_17065 [Pseudomonas chlororaphis]KAB0532758.1 hypothetical protein F7R16_10955 [Pseudomonas chlororaphis subsp. aureofaciens]POA64023.1 hypothetical protein C1888_27785 [Pseudomonas sp. GW531-T4]PWY53426.1 hypothetical protein DK261_00085 [Pseudomonas sp. RW409]TSD26054.1 hypothetical protein FCE86_031835 [Pseudomonas sp. ATCC 13985]